MQKILLLTTLFNLCLHCSLSAADPVPRPVTVCSGANVIIKGDLLTLTSTYYLWEFYLGDTWIDAPGLNTEQNYLLSSLHNPSAVNIAFNLRRKVVIGGVPVYDSYYYVTVQPIIPVTNNLITSPVVNYFCSYGNPATLMGTTPSSGSASFFYQWQLSSDNITFSNINGAYSKDYTPGRITATTYFRRIAISDGCGTTSTSNTVKLSVATPLANNTIVHPDIALLCMNVDPAAITGVLPTGGNGTYTYRWQKSTDNITFTDIVGATGPDYDPPGLSQTTYFRRSVVSEPCNTPLNSNVVTIRVMPELLVPDFDELRVSICSGTSTTLSVNNPIAGMTYNWYDSPDRSNLLFVGQTYTTAALTADKKYYIASDNGVCSSSAMAEIQVDVVPLPESNVLANGGKTSTCSGSTAEFRVVSPNPDFTYNWYTVSRGGTAIGSGSSWTTPAVTSSTTFYLEVVNKQGCASAARQPVEVAVLPVLQAAVVSIDHVTQHSITFRWNVVEGATGYKVSIDNGLTYITPSSGSNGLTHTVDGLRGSESVSIRVKATGSLNCQEGESSTPLTGETEQEFDGLFVPNAFTPNGDGKNDVVYVRSQTVKTLKFYIYSQWGKQLFYSANIANGWDGTSSGSNQPVGVYVYMVKAIMNDGRELNKKGTITLIR